MRNKLNQIVPTVNKEIVFERNVAFEYACLNGKLQKEHLKLSYLQCVVRYFEKNGSILNKRIFLVASKINQAIKVALSMMNYWILEETQNYEKNEHDELLIADLSQEVKTDTGMENPWGGLVMSGYTGAILFFGIEGDSAITHKMNLIRGMNSAIQFIYVNSEDLDSLWVTALMKDKESVVVKVPEVEIGYYQNIVNQLLEEERYCLSQNIDRVFWLRHLMKKAGDSFSEEDIAWALDVAIEENCRKENRFIIEYKDLGLTKMITGDPVSKINGMIGLGTVKRVALEYAALCREKTRNSKLKDISKHMIFSGNPGTGKTMCAKYMADIAATYGEANGTYIVASRKDLIGKYVGHTAPMIEKLFQKSRNGIIFVDEAGFFLRDGTNGFAQEAIKEFVRFMDLYQDITVIFSLYPQEVDAWLELDAGLSSRIGRIVEFCDYTIDELLQITEQMCQDRGYTMREEAKEIATVYLENLSREKRENFGNAREARKLVESAIISKSIRCFEDGVSDEVLKKEDFEESCKRLKVSETKKRRIGF